MAQKQPSPINEKEVHKQLTDLERQVNDIMPHINKAHMAFGGMEEMVQTMTDLKNRIAKAKSIYTS